MANAFAKMRDEFENDLEPQIEKLRKDIARLTRVVSARGSDAFDDARSGASDLYDEMWSRGADAGRELSRQARYASRTARDHPVASSVIAVAVVGLLASLLIRR